MWWRLKKNDLKDLTLSHCFLLGKARISTLKLKQTSPTELKTHKNTSTFPRAQIPAPWSAGGCVGPSSAGRWRGSSSAASPRAPAVAFPSSEVGESWSFQREKDPITETPPSKEFWMSCLVRKVGVGLGRKLFEQLDRLQSSLSGDWWLRADCVVCNAGATSVIWPDPWIIIDDFSLHGYSFTQSCVKVRQASKK